MASSFKLFAGLIFVLATAAVIQAEENAVPVTEGHIAELVKQLDADDFALREAAVVELVEIGPSAAARVAQAAQDESLEASTRAFTILEKWLAGDGPKQAAAKEQLAKLAQGPEESSAARGAKALLNKQQTAPAQGPSVVFGGAFVPGLRVGVARVELRAMAGVAGGVKGRSVSISIVDGKKTMKVVEGDFKAEIIEDAKDGIKMTVTEKDKEGKEKKTEYAAKDTEELKKKHPEGHKVYEKYAGQMNQLKIKMEAAAVPAAAPLLERAKTVPLTKEELKAREEEVRQKVEALKERIEKGRVAPQAEKPSVKLGEPPEPVETE